MTDTVNLNAPTTPIPAPGPLERLRWTLEDWYQRGIWALEDRPILTINAIVLVGLTVWGLWGLWPDHLHAPQDAAALMAPTPQLSVPTVPTTAPPPAGLALPAATVAYAAPDGAVLGALDAGRAYTPLARYGATWLLADVTGSGAVWLLVEDVGLPAGQIADIAPTPAPVVVVIERPVPVPAAAPIVQAPPPGAPVHHEPAALVPVQTTECPTWHAPMASGFCPPTEQSAEGWHAPMVLPEGGE